MFHHILKRFIFIILPISLLAVKQFGKNPSGDSGIGLNIPFLVALLLILLFFVFMIYETINFIISKKNNFAAANFVLIVIIAGIVLLLASF